MSRIKVALAALVGLTLVSGAFGAAAQTTATGEAFGSSFVFSELPPEAASLLGGAAEDLTALCAEELDASVAGCEVVFDQEEGSLSVRFYARPGLALDLIAEALGIEELMPVSGERVDQADQDTCHTAGDVVVPLGLPFIVVIDGIGEFGAYHDCINPEPEP